MRRICRTVSIIAFVALLTAGPAFTQSPTDSPSAEKEAAATVAHVYVQTVQGVNLYTANAAGKLTLVKGSPFATIGQMGGINGKYLISVGTTYLHVYPIEANGVIGKQVSEVNTQDYAGAACGETTGGGAVLDHTGKYFYIQLWTKYTGNCSAWQTYQLSSGGNLTFLGDSEFTSEQYCDANTPNPTISGNDLFGFVACNDSSVPNIELYGPSHILEYQTFQETDPAGEGPALQFAADPADHLAGIVEAVCCNAPNYLASYTINTANGSVTSTNPLGKLPVIGLVPSAMGMSPSGKIVAVGGDPQSGCPAVGCGGLQLFHFNGANPPTAFGPVLIPSQGIDEFGWDQSNHLYALSLYDGLLHVYTITPTSIEEVQGSPFTTTDAYGTNAIIVTR
jgi:hypothetical protein